MSGIIGSKINIRGSGRIAKLGTDGQVLTSGGAGVQANYEDIAAGISWQAIETGSTMTAVAGEGYWVNTTSNACTITLPSSASNGDEIIFVDYDRTWGTYGITIDSNGLNYQGDNDTFDVEYTTDGQALDIVYSGATNGWIPISDDAVADVPVKANDNGLFGFGYGVANLGVTNVVSNVGVVATDTAAVGTARTKIAACEFGGDKGIFGFGSVGASKLATTNLISNAGVVASDTAGAEGVTAEHQLAACSFGGDKGIFGFGGDPVVGKTNLVSSSGVVASDVSAVGTARRNPAGCEFGTDKGIFGYGVETWPSFTAVTNIVSNTGVVASDVSGVGTARPSLAGCSYGEDKGIFGYGYLAENMTNLVSNTGVVGTDVTGVGSARYGLAATQYGKDKGIFGYGATDAPVSMTNLVSNAGVVATDVTGVGTDRYSLAACSYN